MNESFKFFLSSTERERRDVFEKTAGRLGTSPIYVEKDFWVCLVLDLLYNRLPEGHPQLFFKGGTALSKAFDLIRRFSEDIDIVVRREDLGFTGDRDPTIPGGGLSNNKRKTLFKELQLACSAYVFKRLAPALEKLLGEIAEGCRVIRDNSDDSEQTLFMEYSALCKSESDYVEPRVKIEMGARSALVPSLNGKVAPFIAEELDEWSFDVNGIRVIAPQRTYWEKLLILHGWHCGYRDVKRLPRDDARISRHYYDLAMLTTKLEESTLSDTELLYKAREHNLIAFRQAWKRFDEAVPGSLRLVPQPELLEVIERDYENMRRMIFGGAPELGWVMGQIQLAEDTINRKSQ